MEDHPIGAWYSKPYKSKSGTKYSPWYKEGMSPKVSTGPTTIVIKNIQRFLLARGYDLPGKDRAAKMDGWYGAGTAKAVERFQREHKDPVTGKALLADGVFGRLTSRASLVHYAIPAISRDFDIDPMLLGGMCRIESAYDWGAHNRNESEESWGLIQVNRHAHNATLGELLQPSWSLQWAASRIRGGYNSYSDGRCHSTVNPWDLAIAQHNSPRMARQWCESGEPTDWIANYVAKVKMGY